MPIDWHRSQVRNPLGEDGIDRILYRKWHNRFTMDGGWFKAYSFTIFAWIAIIGLAGLFLYFKYNGVWNYNGDIERKLPVILMIFFFVVRFHLALLPSLVIIADVKTSLWEHFRITKVAGDDVSKAMLVHAFNKGVLPLAIICTAETWLYMVLVNPILAEQNIIGGVLTSFIFYVILGMFLTGLGIIGALIWRNIFGAVTIMLLPMILAMLAAGHEYIQSYINSLSSVMPVLLSSKPVSLFFSPENRFAWTGDSLSRHGVTSIPGIDTGMILEISIGLGIVTAVLWIGLWLVLRHRLRLG